MPNCTEYRERIPAYIDGELPTAEMESFRQHAQTCADCAASALAMAQMKLAIRRAGTRYTAPAELRARILKSVASQPAKAKWQAWGGWALWASAAAALLLVAAGLSTAANRRQQRQTLAEFADLHVTTLASANPVEVISSDRHTVKPWFQGRIPFAFDLPELGGSPFTLVGGRVVYFHQEPGAHLVFGYQRHRISAFVFRDGPQLAFPSGLPADRSSSFNLRTWQQGGLRFVLVGDVNAETIEQLSILLKHTH